MMTIDLPPTSMTLFPLELGPKYMKLSLVGPIPLVMGTHTSLPLYSFGYVNTLLLL